MIEREALGCELEPLRILIISDAPESVEFMRFWLIYAGTVVAWAEDPSCARREVSRFRPHLVLLDLAVPGVEELVITLTVPGVDELDTATRMRRESEFLILILSTEAQSYDYNSDASGNVKCFDLAEPEGLMVRIDAIAHRRAATSVDVLPA